MRNKILKNITGSCPVVNDEVTVEIEYSEILVYI